MARFSKKLFFLGSISFLFILPNLVKAADCSTAGNLFFCKMPDGTCSPALTILPGQTATCLSGTLAGCTQPAESPPAACSTQQPAGPTTLGCCFYAKNNWCKEIANAAGIGECKSAEGGDFKAGVPCSQLNCTITAAPTPTGQTPYTYYVTPPTLQIPIPGLLTNFSSALPLGGPGERYFYMPWVGEYIAAVYKYTLGIVGILAAVMIIWAGIVWLTAAGSPERINLAKEYISGAVIGLVLAFGSYLILYTLNPDLVKFEAMKIKVVERIPLPSPSESSPTSGGTSGEEAPPNLTDIKGENMKRAFGKAIPELVTVFQNAASNIKSKGCAVIAATASRNRTDQLKLTKDYCEWNDAYKAYINCKNAVGLWGSTSNTPSSSTCRFQNSETPSPPCTLSGITHWAAIDAFAGESSAEKRCFGKKECMRERCQIELVQEMTTKGACLLLGRAKDPNSGSFEPWHLELASDKNSGSCFTNAQEILKEKSASQ